MDLAASLRRAQSVSKFSLSTYPAPLIKVSAKFFSECICQGPRGHNQCSFASLPSGNQPWWRQKMAPMLVQSQPFQHLLRSFTALCSWHVLGYVCFIRSSSVRLVISHTSTVSLVWAIALYWVCFVKMPSAFLSQTSSSRNSCC